MTSQYVIKIGSASAKAWVQFSYEKTLNGMSTCQIALDGVTAVYSAEFDVDNEIFIYKSGTLVFRGQVIEKQSLIAGGIVLIAFGIEIELTDSKSPMVSTATSRVWTATSDHTILSTEITSVSGWTLNTSNSTPINIDFRTTATESVWNAVIRIIESTGKDIYIDQANKVVYLYDELTQDGIFAFVEGKNAYGLSQKKTRSRAGKVIVYGKGDGTNQIKGSYGSGTPVHSIIDRNIITTDDADARAEVEYNKLNPQQLTFTFTPVVFGTLAIGDSGTVTNNSAGISATVDIVRIKTLVDQNGTEKLDVEVTNPSYRLATKNSAEARVKESATLTQSQTSMQGSGNTQIWASGINAKSGSPAKIGFYISPVLVQDEAGNLRINSLTLDYDVDPFNQQYGTASFDGTDPQVQNTSGNTQPDVANSSGSTTPDVTGTSASTTLASSTDTDSFAENVATTWDLIMSTSNTGSFDFMYVDIEIEHDGFSGTDTIALEIRRSGTPVVTDMGIGYDTSLGPFKKTYVFPLFASISAQNVDIYMVSAAGADYQGSCTVYGSVQSHTHADGTFASASHSHDDGTYSAADHGHPDGSYDINAADIDNISIGDDVSEAVSVSATEVDIYLDYWNGSAWVNKHSILATGTTIDNDVDITNSGAYPDVAGYWRVRIDTDSATPDFVQGIVKLKHNLEN